MLGRCSLNYVVPIQILSDTNVKFTIQVFAWCENVQLSGAVSNLALQAGEQDEFGSGPISKPAFAVAAMAAKLSTIPMISKYALATSFGATALGKIARLFGFTNVPVIKPPEPVKISAVPMFASAEVGFPSNSISLDPKAQLTVDPSTLGLPPHDDMSISSIVMRESYYSQTEWQCDLGPTPPTGDHPGALLAGFVVTPNYFKTGPVSNHAAPTVFTPMGYVSQAFTSWRGESSSHLRIPL